MRDAGDDIRDEDIPLDALADRELEREETAERRGLGKGLAIGAVAVALLGLALWWLVAMGPMRSQAPVADNTAPVTTLPDDGTAAPSLAPTASVHPTDAPVQNPSASATAAQAPETADPGATTQGQPTGDVVVALTRWNWIAPQQMISVAGYLPQIVEEGGTCTLVARSGATELRNSAAAAPDAHQTACIVNLTNAAITPGQWTVRMEYTGPSGSGASPEAVVTAQ